MARDTSEQDRRTAMLAFRRKLDNAPPKFGPPDIDDEAESARQRRDEAWRRDWDRVPRPEYGDNWKTR